ncbi:uncharacterized protein [Palaemon carinicauda]|uniref:uncharacterized protein isoform X1 n=1 Tax=Palaemon carinicauda TaxID=392227 RepID=UPI0035B65125
MDPIDWKEIILSILRLWWMCIYGLFCIAESTVRFFLPRDYQRKDVKDEIVLITGGGSGIGRLLCLKFAEKGAKIVTWDIDEEANKRTAQMVAEKGSICRPYTVDLSNPKDIYATAAKVKQEFGKVDILVNNAAIVTSSSLMNSLDDDIIQTFEINALSHFWTVKAFLGDMKLSNKGHIVTIASMAGWIGYNKMVDYCSSKFAAVGFDEALRMELKSSINDLKNPYVNEYPRTKENTRKEERKTLKEKLESTKNERLNLMETQAKEIKALQERLLETEKRKSEFEEENKTLKEALSIAQVREDMQEKHEETLRNLMKVTEEKRLLRDDYSKKFSEWKEEGRQRELDIQELEKSLYVAKMENQTLSEREPDSQGPNNWLIKEYEERNHILEEEIKELREGTRILESRFREEELNILKETERLQRWLQGATERLEMTEKENERMGLRMLQLDQENEGLHFQIFQLDNEVELLKKYNEDLEDCVIQLYRLSEQQQLLSIRIFNLLKQKMGKNRAAIKDLRKHNVK